MLMRHETERDTLRILFGAARNTQRNFTDNFVVVLAVSFYWPLLSFARYLGNLQKSFEYRERERLGVDYRLVSRSGIKTFLPNV